MPISKSDLTQTYASEFKEYTRLAGEVRSTSGAYNFTSASSSAVYSGASGGEAQLFSDLAAALTNYLLTSTEINTVVTKDGAQTITGNKTCLGLFAFNTLFPTTPSSAPTTDYQVGNKKYTDDEVETYTGSEALSSLTTSAKTSLVAAINEVNAATGAFPSGVVMQTATLTAPSGWMICDGSAISRTTYANLFSAIGEEFGSGDGSTTFNIPDIRGNIPVGYKSGDSNFGTFAGTGGAKTHTLSTSETPTHSHSFSGNGTTSIQASNHTHSGTTGGTTTVSTISNTVAQSGSSQSVSTGGSLSSHTHSFTTGSNSGNHTHSFSYSGTTGNSGSGSAHNNIQPYIVMHYIIKI